MWLQDTGGIVFSNSPAAIVKVKTDGDLCALGDGPQRVDVQMKHSVLNHVSHLTRKVTMLSEEKNSVPIESFFFKYRLQVDVHDLHFNLFLKM